MCCWKFYGLDKSYKPFTYLNLVLPIFAAAIVGGVGNPIGAIIGGFVIAYSEIIITFAYRKLFGIFTSNEILSDKFDASSINRLQDSSFFS